MTKEKFNPKLFEDWALVFFMFFVFPCLIFILITRPPIMNVDISPQRHSLSIDQIKKWMVWGLNNLPIGISIPLALFSIALGVTWLRKPDWFRGGKKKHWSDSWMHYYWAVVWFFIAVFFIKTMF